MAPEGVKRKISAILSADVAGYSRLMEADEETTVRTMESYRETISSLIEQHDGHVIDSPGDNLLSEFPSVVDSVQCAVEIQHVIRAKNAVLPEARRMEFRIGINLGDVIEEKGRTYGDGINIASRIEGLADAGGICISESAYQQIETKLALGYVDLGEHEVKNISKPVRVYRIPMDSRNGVGATSTESAGKKRWRKLPIALSITVVLLIGLAAGWYLRSQAPSTDVDSPHRPVASAEKPSIAVLPFSNLSAEPDQEYFADAMTDEIIARLSKNSMLTVIARNSTFTYKGKAVKVQQVGQELGVKHVLEGSVQKAGNRVRIIAQLVDAATGGHLWSGTYERELQDTFAIQAEIAESIAAALRVAYTEAELARVRRIPTDDLTAYDSYWRGYDHYTKFTKDGLAKARKHSVRAIELDPTYADAYALLGHTYLFDYYYGYSKDPQTMAQAFELSEKALSLDDTSIFAHTLQAWFYYLKDQNQLALAKAKKALSLDPNNPVAHIAMVLPLEGMGRYEEGIEYCIKATQLDPYNAWFSNDLGYEYRCAGKYEQAIAAYKRAIALRPGPETVWYSSLVWTYGISWRTQQNEDPRVLDEALAMAKEIVPLDGLRGHAALSEVYFRRKQHDLAIAEAEEALAVQPKSAWLHAGLAEIYSFVGRPEEALEMAEKVVQTEPYLVHPGPAWCAYSQGNAYRVLERPEEAIAAYRECLSRPPPHDLAYSCRLGLTIVYAELGRMEEARAEAAEVMKLVPSFSVKVYGEREPYADPAQAERDMAALRKAGLK